MYADHVIVVTDNLVRFPAFPGISREQRRLRVEVDTVGDPSKIVSGRADHQRARRLLISEYVARFLRDAGSCAMGFPSRPDRAALRSRSSSTQGHDARSASRRVSYAGIDAVPRRHAQRRAHRLHPRRQTFDLAGVRSMAENPRHVATSPSRRTTTTEGNFAHMVDAPFSGRPRWMSISTRTS